MKRVVIESPLGRRPDGSVVLPGSPEWNENIAYARAAVRDCLRRGESPYASHLFFPQVLDDATPEERELGIAAGLEWGKAASSRVIYTDRGVTEGMKMGIVAAASSPHQTIEVRKL